MLLLHPSTRSVNNYYETGKTHVVMFHAVQSTAAISDRTISEYSSALLETVSVDSWQTPFSINGNAVHTRQISVDGDR